VIQAGTVVTFPEQRSGAAPGVFVSPAKLQLSLYAGRPQAYDHVSIARALVTLGCNFTTAWWVTSTSPIAVVFVATDAKGVLKFRRAAERQLPGARVALAS